MHSLRQSKSYRLFLWIAFSICIFLAVWRASSAVMHPDWFSGDDYIEYWAAAKLIIQDGNPYDPSELLSIQKLAGRVDAEAVLMWNPPWTLPLLFPLGVLTYPASRFIWLVINIVLTILCTDTLWKYYGGQSRLRWISWILGFTFIPVLDALKKGQTGILILLGIVGFLYFASTKKYWLAGFSLALVAVKPHVAYLFILAVFLWSIDRKRWEVLGGFSLMLIGATIIVLAANDQIISQYINAINHYPPRDWATPTVGGLLRILFGRNIFWLQFLPSLIGAIWLGIYWIEHKKFWNWRDQAPMIILVSLVTTAYGWSFDQPALLVAIVHIFVLAIPLLWESTALILLVSYLLINVIELIGPDVQILKFWLAPAILIWYLFSRHLLYRAHRTYEKQSDFLVEE